MKVKCKVSQAGGNGRCIGPEGGPACVFEEQKDSQHGYSVVNKAGVGGVSWS